MDLLKSPAAAVSIGALVEMGDLRVKLSFFHPKVVQKELGAKHLLRIIIERERCYHEKVIPEPSRECPWRFAPPPPPPTQADYAYAIHLTALLHG